MTTLQEWIAESIEGSATWRDSVSERYPEDARNEHSAAALRELAAIVRGLSDDDTSLAKLRTLLAVSGGGVETISLPDEVGRFGFESTRRRVGYTDAFEALDRIYWSNLWAWRDSDDPDVVLPPALVEVLDRELGPEDEADEEDAIEAVHARIDRLEARVARLERMSTGAQSGARGL